MERITGLPTLLIHWRLKLATTIACAVLASVITPSVNSSGANPLPRVSSPCSAVADGVSGASAASQLVTVISPTLRSQSAVLNFYVRQGGCFRLVDGPYSALVGLNGLSTHHHEGDDTTPIGLFGFQSTMYGVLANPGVAYHYHHLVCGDWWDEQSSSPLYNHFVHVPCGTKPNFGGGSEALWQTVPSYDYFAVIAYNRNPIVPGRGSAIFLHVSNGSPTAGCVSVRANELLRVLRALRPNLHPLIDITTRQLLTP